ncbi:NAD-dependent epimerase [Longibacter salinarum]|uniref:NAD-dependent epimerase n=1 Tax=Longibacter salinarum TaxID=1850348 RepID=A0A2A8CU85_9BACT|nr:NAD-dependent epimerase/dehydratase family protein [Longibacter salinarum]PEN11405.1 NAD-dependent epimerase [Longibacter salinarum]
MSSILVTGANGQIGSELVQTLRDRHGDEHVVRLDLRPPSSTSVNGSVNGQNATSRTAAPFVVADVRDRDTLAETIERYDIDTVYHLASLLSANGEKVPDRTWDVNINGLKHVLDLARDHDLRIFWPSSIAVFGPSTPRNDTPQNTILNPSTMYGVTKRSGELLCQYYHQRFGVDVRSLRYPGLISYATLPGGGTTDYAVDMYYEALRSGSYTCFVRADTRLPMMYMPDAIRATLDLMNADADNITIRDSYNITAMSFSAEELADAIRAHLPDFTCDFEPDERQQIADAWPATIDDRIARRDWNWKPDFNLDAMTADMLAHLRDTVQQREDVESVER